MCRELCGTEMSGGHMEYLSFSLVWTPLFQPKTLLFLYLTHRCSPFGQSSINFPLKSGEKKKNTKSRYDLDLPLLLYCNSILKACWRPSSTLCLLLNYLKDSLSKIRLSLKSVVLNLKISYLSFLKN